MSGELRAPLAVAGPLTIPHIAERHAELRAWMDEGGLALDLSAVPECDTAGVQLLLAARRAAAAAGQALRLDAPSAAVAEALRRCGAALGD